MDRGIKINTQPKCKFCGHEFTFKEIRAGEYWRTNIRTVLGVQEWDYACRYHPQTKEYISGLGQDKIGKCAINIIYLQNPLKPAKNLEQSNG